LGGSGARCGNWSECRAVYDSESLISGEVEGFMYVVEERLCTFDDKNFFIEVRECSEKVEIETVSEFRCGAIYETVVDALNGKRVARLRTGVVDGKPELDIDLGRDLREIVCEGEEFVEREVNVEIKEDYGAGGFWRELNALLEVI